MEDAVSLLSQFENIASTTAASGLSNAAGDVASSLLGGIGISSSSTPKEQRSAYQFSLIQGSNIVIGYLSEEFGFSLGAGWAAKYEDAFSDQVGKLGDLASTVGIKLTNKYLSYKFFQGSESVAFSLDLILLAENGPQDIVNALRNLYFMTLPSSDGAGWLSAPGPKFSASNVYQSLKNVMQTNPASINGTNTPSSNTASNVCGPDYKLQYGSFDFNNLFTDVIQLRIGNFLTIPSVVITGIDNSFKVKMTPDGIPLQATVRISVQTHATPTAEDVSRWINYGSQSIPQSSFSGATTSTVGGLFNTGLNAAKSAVEKVWGSL